MARRHGQLLITKDEMRAGLAAGRVLIQEEWAHPYEIRFVDELVAEGFAVAEDWRWTPAFQCDRRFVRGAKTLSGRVGHG